MNFSIIYLSILFTCLSIFIFAINWSKKPWYHVYPSQEWYDVNEKEMPLDNEWSTFLITDGIEVKETQALFIKYNRFGKPVFWCEKRLITHWAPMPKPPEL